MGVEGKNGGRVFHPMARPLRIEYPGAIDHVLSRGDRREAIFRTEADRKLFLDLLGQTCRRTGCQIHAYWIAENLHMGTWTYVSNRLYHCRWVRSVNTWL
jgi:hypothetical protein